MRTPVRRNSIVDRSRITQHQRKMSVTQKIISPNTKKIRDAETRRQELTEELGDKLIKKSKDAFGNLNAKNLLRRLDKPKYKLKKEQKLDIIAMALDKTVDNKTKHRNLIDPRKNESLRKALLDRKHVIHKRRHELGIPTKKSLLTGRDRIFMTNLAKGNRESGIRLMKERADQLARKYEKHTPPLDTTEIYASLRRDMIEIANTTDKPKTTMKKLEDGFGEALSRILKRDESVTIQENLSDDGDSVSGRESASWADALGDAFFK